MWKIGNASFIIWRLHRDRDRRQECQSDLRVIAIQALEKLGAVAALPHLHALLNDHEKTHYGAQISVAEAAKAAIAALETKR
jgi:hypothetical protein